MKLFSAWRTQSCLTRQKQQQREQGHAQQGRCQKMMHLKTNAIITISVALLLLCMSWNTKVHGFQLHQQQRQHPWRRSFPVLYHHHYHQHHHDNNESRTGCTAGWCNNPTSIKVGVGENEKVNSKDTDVMQRRSILHSLAVASLALAPTYTMLPRSSLAASISSLSSSRTQLDSSLLSSSPSSSTFASSATTLSTAVTPSTTTTAIASTNAPTFISPDQATITDKVYMNVRISRQDGTFYVRDDLPDTPENKVFYGRLVFALFGQEAPRHVEKFKSYITTPAPLDGDNDDPLPSYDRSTFTSFDQNTGVIMGGKIPSLELTEMAGSTALRYGGRLLPASLWLEQRSSSSAKPRTIISHSGRGLLTHRQLETLPDFGITTRTDTTMLDRTHVVFGKLVLDDDAQAFLNIVSNLPTYGMERPNPYINNEDDMLQLESSSSTSNKSNSPALVDDAAAAVFKAQRQFFRKTAKALGDSRLDKLYEGKLLRRVEVTSTGIMK